MSTGANRVDRRWRRIAGHGTVHPLLARIARNAARLDRREQAARVHAAMNHAIAYRSDRDNWGVDDYWATARETLDRRSGDCEDIAIAKLHALRLLGFSADDLYLSVGRDRRRGDHALLLVRIDDRFWVLDDRLEAPILAETVRGFSPVMTFAGSHAWIHGIRRAASGQAIAGGQPD